MIKFFDKFGNELDGCDLIEFSWNRKFFESGNFTLYLPAKNYAEDIKYVQVDGRPETGIVQKKVYEEKPEGNFVTLSGFFIEKLLDGSSTIASSIIFESTEDRVKERIKHILYETFPQLSDKLKNSMSSTSGLKQAFSTDRAVLYETTISDDSHVPKSAGVFFSHGEPIGAKFYELLKSENMSYYCNPSFFKDEEKPLLGIEVKTIQGRNLKDKIIFSKELGNVRKVEYVRDESNAKSHLVGVQVLPEDIHYPDEKTILTPDFKSERIITEEHIEDRILPRDFGKSYPKKVIQTNITDIKEDNETSVRSQMRRALRLEMLNNYMEETISVDVIQHRFLYLKDYDLGDEVTIHVDELKVQYNSRIIEVREVYKNNQLEIEIVLGTPRKSEYRKVLI